MKLIDRFNRLRNAQRRRSRLLFPSPAEMEFVRCMGGLVISLPIYSLRNHFPLCIVIWRGWTLQRHGIQREYRCSGYSIDFANKRKGIEIDGKAYHSDYRKDWKRDQHIKQKGIKILRIKGHEIYRNPAHVKRRVKKWLRHK